MLGAVLVAGCLTRAPGTEDGSEAGAAREGAGDPAVGAGAAIRPGGHALWMRRRWLHEARTDEEIRELARQLDARGIAVIYPFLGPMGPEGRPGWRDGEVIRPYEDATAARFFAAMQREAPDVRVIPWSGGILGQNVHPEDPVWRARFVAAMRQVVRLGAAGVQLNVEPLPTGTPGFLELLAEVRAGIREERGDAILSVAAYPPPTPLHPYPDVHWELPFLTEVCAIADDVSVMAYDTALRDQGAYTGLVAEWTRGLAGAFAGGRCAWRVGVPSYEDEEPWHDPRAEALAGALAGVRAGLPEARRGFSGVAIYASWTTDAAEWAAYDQWRGAAVVDLPLLEFKAADPAQQGWRAACPDLPDQPPPGLWVERSRHDYRATRPRDPQNQRPEAMERYYLHDAARACPADQLSLHLQNFYPPRRCVPVAGLDQRWGALLALRAIRVRSLPLAPHRAGWDMEIHGEGLAACRAGDVLGDIEVHPDDRAAWAAVEAALATGG